MRDTPIDVQNPDSLIDLINRQASDEQKAAEERESAARQTAAKAAHKAQILRAKRRNWLWHLVHWLVHYAGIGSMIYLLFLLWIPGGVALAMAILAIAESAYRLKFIARAYPKK